MGYYSELALEQEEDDHGMSECEWQHATEEEKEDESKEAE